MPLSVALSRKEAFKPPLSRVEITPGTSPFRSSPLPLPPRTPKPGEEQGTCVVPLGIPVKQACGFSWDSGILRCKLLK